MGHDHPERETVRFFALDDQISIMFVVSVEALWDLGRLRTPHTKEEAVRVFEEHRPRIEEVARAKYQLEGIDEEDQVLLISADFERY